MLMSTRTKGRGNEMKAKKILEAAGYEVQLTSMGTKYNKQTDMFGLWDLIAVDSNSVRFIQVKTNRKVYGVAREKYESFRCPASCSKEIWVFMDGFPRDPVIDYL